MSMLSPDVEKKVEEVMKTGGFASADDVVLAGIRALQGDFEPGEMEQLLLEGEQSETLDGEQVLAELRAMREQARVK